jgi:hypothetical protein
VFISSRVLEGFAEKRIKASEIPRILGPPYCALRQRAIRDPLPEREEVFNNRPVSGDTGVLAALMGYVRVGRPAMVVLVRSGTLPEIPRTVAAIAMERPTIGINLWFPCTHADTPGTWRRYRKALPNWRMFWFQARNQHLRLGLKWTGKKHMCSRLNSRNISTLRSSRLPTAAVQAFRRITGCSL